MEKIRKAELTENKKIIVSFKDENREKFYRIVNKMKKMNGRHNSKNQTWSIVLSLQNLKTLKKMNFSFCEELKKYYTKTNKISKNYGNSLLKDYQNKHINKLIPVLIKNFAAVDGSDTGTGKTYTSSAIAKLLNLKIIALVPIASISKWQEVAGEFGVDIFASNYEQFRIGNIKYLQRKNFVKKIKNKNGKIVEKKCTKFAWQTNKKHLIIFDECHRCKGHETLNGKMLRACANINSYVLCLSATIAADALELYNLGLVIRLFRTWLEFRAWGSQRGIKDGFWVDLEFSATKENLLKIHKDIYPGKGARMKVSEIPDFPENNIICDVYDMQAAEIIQEKYDLLKNTLEITKRIKARQEIELLKVDTIIELARDLLAQNYSVCIFVNFRQTIIELMEKFGTDCVIWGGMKKEEREKNIANFQSNKKKLIILNNQAGGESISLHDMTGSCPRVSIINMPESAKNLKQVFGRIRRQGTKANKVTQILVFCRKTIEESVAKNIRKKIGNIDLINDGDLAYNEFDIKGEKI